MTCMTDKAVTELVEPVLDALWQEVDRQTDGSWPNDTNDDETIGLVDAHLDFEMLAKAAIAPIANTLTRQAAALEKIELLARGTDPHPSTSLGWIAEIARTALTGGGPTDEA